MPQNWRLNGYIDPVKTQGLYEAMSRRESCRSFMSAPTAAQWEGLSAAAASFSLPGVRLIPGVCNNELFSPFFGLLMKFENVQRFAAVITTDDAAQSIVNAGISGEMLMLEAVDKGLGGCWVAGTYKRRDVGIVLKEGEKIRGLIALGVPERVPELPIKRKRKPLADLCSPNFSEAPAVFLEVARAIHCAPSAVNFQPWRLVYEPEKTLSIGVKRARLDLGIALCHAALAAGNTPVQYELSEDGLTARMTV